MLEISTGSVTPLAPCSGYLIDCALPHAPPVHMIKLLQEWQIMLVGYPEEY
jgi:hypothetical protein